MPKLFFIWILELLHNFIRNDQTPLPDNLPWVWYYRIFMNDQTFLDVFHLYTFNLFAYIAYYSMNIPCPLIETSSNWHLKFKSMNKWYDILVKANCLILLEYESRKPLTNQVLHGLGEKLFLKDKIYTYVGKHSLHHTKDKRLFILKPNMSDYFLQMRILVTPKFYVLMWKKIHEVFIVI